MTELPKFGDKSIGRSPIERLIIWLEARRLLLPTVMLCILLFLIGLNATVHVEFAKGLTYLIIVFFILVYRRVSVQDFFGAPALAVLITIHQALFGFNAMPLIITFLIFIFLRSKKGISILLPISLYLLLDTGFIYFNLGIIFDSYFNSFSYRIFSQEMIGIVTIVPLSYAYLRFERFIRKHTSNNFIYNYGAMLVLGGVMCLFMPIGYLLNRNLVLIIIGTASFVIYFIGLLQFKNIPQILFLYVPLVILLLELYILKLFR